MQHKRFYRHFKCVLIEVSVNCIDYGQISPVLSYTAYFYIDYLAKSENVAYPEPWSSIHNVHVGFDVTFTYFFHVSLSKIWYNFVLSGGNATDCMTNHIKSIKNFITQSYRFTFKTKISFHLKKKKRKKEKKWKLSLDTLVGYQRCYKISAELW